MGTSRSLGTNVCPCAGFSGSTGKLAFAKYEHVFKIRVMNRYLFELLRRIEDSARRLASIIIHTNDTPMREILLVDVEVTEIENALAEFKAQVATGASVGEVRGRMTKE
jgi:hypothetical protein